MLIIHDQTPKVENLICMQQNIPTIYRTGRLERQCSAIHTTTIATNTSGVRKCSQCSCLERIGAWLHTFNNISGMVSLWSQLQCLNIKCYVAYLIVNFSTSITLLSNPIFSFRKNVNSIKIKNTQSLYIRKSGVVLRVS